MKRALCIWLPNWPIQRLRAAQPELKDRLENKQGTVPIFAQRKWDCPLSKCSEDQPVVLYQSCRGVPRVAACSAQAAALGAAVGMPLAEVKAVCGSAKMVPYDPPSDRRALEALAEHCGRFSPVVGLEQSAAPDSLLLDITGLAHLFGGEDALAEQIVRDFARRELFVRVAIADTIGAAWAVAHYGGARGQGRGVRGQGSGVRDEGRGRNGNCKLPVETAHAICKPPSAFRPPPSALRLPSALRPLPIAALRLPEEVVGLLRQLGIERIGQLEALPRRELSARFGPQLLKRMDQASGRLAEPVAACGPLPELRAEWSLEYPTIRRETIAAVLEHLLLRVATMLVQCGRGTLRLECRLTCAPCGAVRASPVQISLGLFEPTASAAHLFQLVQMRLERMRLASPVTAIQVEAAATAPLQQRQQELFCDDSARRHPRHLAGLVDRLSSRLGCRAVVGVRLIPDAQPEKAWQYQPLVNGSRRRLKSSREASRGLSQFSPERKWDGPLPNCSSFLEDHLLPPRPLRLLPAAVRLAATSIVPDGPPLRFCLHGCRHQVARTWGPERIETGWWRGRTVGRDYYRVETTTGRRFWLFRRLRDGQWFLHGMFE
jgi:protein ImuB